MAAEQETNAEIKSMLMKLAEKIRFSDPMSSEKLVDLEKTISNKAAELKIAENKMTIITELDSLITERNKRVKMLK